MAPVGIHAQTVPTTRARSVRNDEPHPEPQRRPRSAGHGPLALLAEEQRPQGVQQAPLKTSGRGVPLKFDELIKGSSALHVYPITVVPLRE